MLSLCLCSVQDLNATAQKWLESLLRPVDSEETYPLHARATSSN